MPNRSEEVRVDPRGRPVSRFRALVLDNREKKVKTKQREKDIADGIITPQDIADEIAASTPRYPNIDPRLMEGF